MIQLLRSHLAHYKRDLAFVVTLLILQVLGSLYLPDLNADIINKGVATGDAAYIVRVGAWMLIVALAVAVASIAVREAK